MQRLKIVRYNGLKLNKILKMGFKYFPGHTQILSHSRGKKLGEGLGSKLRHGPEMVDSVS